MGVRGLESYMMSIPKGYISVNILDEIIEFKKKYNKRPIIIFDMMGVIHAFGGNVAELLCGGRHIIYLTQMAEFVRRISAAGAKLVFFCDGQLRTVKVDEWCRRRNDEYQEYSQILQKIDNGHGVENGRYRACKTVVGSMLLIAREYGEVIISTDFDCDAAIAQYAVNNEALAVVATDSDNLIFEGEWKYWHGLKIDFRNMRIMQFGRQELRNQLQLTCRELWVFATILGTDYSKHIADNMKSFGGPKSVRFENIAKYVRSLRVNDNYFDERFYKRYCRELYPRCLSESSTIEMISNSICSYMIDFTVPDGTDILEAYTVQNVLMAAILKNGIFQYEVNLIDFVENNNIKISFVDVIMPVFQKLAGILFRENMDQYEDLELRIVIKESCDEDYKLMHVEPIYPQNEITSLKEFLFKESVRQEEERWDILIWSLSLNDITTQQIRGLPKRFLIVVLALKFLVQEIQITVPEADAILVTEYDILQDTYHPKNYAQPDVLDGRSVRIAHIYNKTTVLIWDCLHICGLNKHIESFLFDGFYFHLLNTQQRKISVLDLERRNIVNLRIYK